MYYVPILKLYHEKLRKSNDVIKKNSGSDDFFEESSDYSSNYIFGKSSGSDYKKNVTNPALLENLDAQAKKIPYPKLWSDIVQFVECHLISI